MNHSNKLSINMTKGESTAGWVCLAAYLVILPLLLQYLFILMGLDATTTAGKVQLNVLFYIISFVSCLVIFNKFLMGNFVQIFKHFWAFVQAVILGGFMYGFFYQILVYIVSRIVPELGNPNNDAVFAMVAVNRPVMVASIVAVVPLIEECLFRGVVFRGIYGKSRLSAYMISALAFSLIHVLSYTGQLTRFSGLLLTILYLPAGVALAWTYERADSIFAPVLLHSLINAYSLGFRFLR